MKCKKLAITLIALVAVATAQAIQVKYDMESDSTGATTFTDTLTGDGSQNGTGVSDNTDANVDVEVSAGAYNGLNGAEWTTNAAPNDAIEVAGSSGTALGTQFTLATWVDAAVPTNYNRIMSTHDGVGGLTNDLFFSINPRGYDGGHQDSWEYTILLQLENIPVRAFSSEAGTVFFDDGGWHHVAATYSNGVMNLYVDGMWQANRVIADGTITLDRNIRIGGDYTNGYGNAQFQGHMDDIQILDTAKSAAEILAMAGTTLSETLTVTAGTGGSVSPTNENYVAGAKVNVVATPDSEYQFVTWSGSGTNAIVSGSVTEPSITVAMDSSVTLNAEFEFLPAVTNLQVFYGMEEDALHAKTFTDGAIDDGSQNGIGFSDTGDANVELEVNAGSYFGSHGVGWFSGSEANDVIEVPQSYSNALVSGSSGANQFTLAAWVDTTRTNVYNRIMSTHDGVGSLYNDLFFAIRPGGHSTATWEYTIGLQVDNVMVRAYANSGATTFADGDWHHVAATYNAGQIDLYLDGVWEAGGTAGDGIITLDRNIRIGGDHAGGYANGQFKGQMDDILVWSRALSSNEIVEVATKGVAYALLNEIPEIGDIAMTNLTGTSDFEITWPTAKGLTYALEETSDLPGGSWNTNQTVTGTGGDVSATTTASQAASFYRVTTE